MILAICCRFITLMAYLNDVEEGGETAFPAADNATYDSNVSTFCVELHLFRQIPGETSHA